MMTVTQFQSRALERLGELSAKPAYFKGSEVLAKLNEAQRFLVLLTLADFLLPFRIRITAGARPRSNRL